MPLANVVGDPDRKNSPNMRNDTGMMAVRLKSLDDTVVILPSCYWLRTTTNRAQEAERRLRLMRRRYAAIWTLICLGLTSSRSGSRTVSMPALYSALTLLLSTVGGSANVRANGP
jgi:hypothetical protein